MTGGEEGVLGTETHDSLSKSFGHAGGNRKIGSATTNASERRILGKAYSSGQCTEDWCRGGIEVDFAARAERASARVSVTHTKKVE